MLYQLKIKFGCSMFLFLSVSTHWDFIFVIKVLLIRLFKLFRLYQRDILENNFMINFSYYLGIIVKCFSGIDECIIPRIQRRIQNPVKRLRWIFSGKYLTASSRCLHLRKAPSKMFDRVLNKHKMPSTETAQVRNCIYLIRILYFHSELMPKSVS